MAGKARCLACGRPVSRYAARCPHCGAAQPQKRVGSTIGLAVTLFLLILALAWALAGR